jgi:hypothetical protein
MPEWVQLGVSYALFAVATAVAIWLLRESIRRAGVHAGAVAERDAGLQRMLCLLADIRAMLVVRTVRPGRRVL